MRSCDEVLLLGVCSSADEALMESLLNLHGEEGAGGRAKARSLKAPPAKPGKAAEPRARKTTAKK